MIDPEVRVQIRRYFYAEHWKVGTIAQALSVHPDTVKRAIEVERFHRAERLRATMLDAYLPYPSGQSHSFLRHDCMLKLRHEGNESDRIGTSSEPGRSGRPGTGF